MTIKGLHDVLKRHNLKKSVRLCDKYANKRLAVDVSDWLYWAKFHQLKELGRVPTADDIVEACCDRVKLLLEHQAIPVLVFDGAAVPAKAETDARRERCRPARHTTTSTVVCRHRQTAAVVTRRGGRTRGRDRFRGPEAA